MDTFNALRQRFGHHDHARPTTKRAMIDAAVMAFCEVARIVHIHLDLATLKSSAIYAHGKHG
jgi:hypothetical protein